MADPALFPDGENIAHAKDYLSVQQQLADLMRKQKSVYDDIGKINKDVEANVRVRYEREKDFLKQIKAQKVFYYEEEAKGRTNLNDAERKSHKAALHSIRVEMKSLQEKFSVSRAISEMEMDMAKKQHAEDTKWFNFASDKLKEMTGLEVKQFTITKSTGDQLVKLGVKSEAIAYTFGAIFMMLKGAFDLFKKMDAAAWNFRTALGMTRLESQAIRKDAERLAIDYMAMGVTIEGVYKSYQAIGQAVGGVHNVTKDMARDVSLMSAQLGISEETSANFLRNLAAVSKNSMESQTNMMGLAQAMSSAAGVNLGEVMSDVAKASGPTLTMMSRLPNIALRSAIELRRMGTSLGEAAKSSRHMLNFTENMNEEMEASVLLGRSINLQHARELAYKRDLEGSTKEILRITKSVDFANLDVFQQEAFAAATGKSVDELMKMLQTDEQIARVKRKGTAEQKTELANYEKIRQSNEAAAKARGKDAMVMLRTMANQERMTQLSNKWNALLAKAQQFLLPILDTVLGVALSLMDWVPSLMSVSGWFAPIIEYSGQLLANGVYIVSAFEKMLHPLAMMGGIFGKVATIGLKFGIGISKILAPFGKIIGFLGKFLGVFGKFLGPIGLVIMAFQGISGIISGWKSAEGGFFSKLFGAIMGGLGGIIPGFDYIVKAVKWVWGWLGKIVVFSFKWLTPVGQIITGFKFLKKLFPETFSAVGNLFGKIWGVYKKIASVGWNIFKFLFKWTTPIGLVIQGIKFVFKHLLDVGVAISKMWGLYKKISLVGLSIFKTLFKWTTPIGLLIRGIKMIWPSIREVFSKAWAKVVGFFGMAKSGFSYIKGLFKGGVDGLVNMVDNLMASIVNGITSIGSTIWHGLTDPFRDAWGWVKSLWGGNSPSQVGLSILNGIVSIGENIYNALTHPFKSGMDWITNHIPGVGKLINLFHGGAAKASASVEKRAQAAYVPAVTVTPNGTQIETPKARAEAANGKKDKEESRGMTEETGQRMVALLEKILAKDNSIRIDSSELSTRVSRGVEFKGNYGVNR